MKKFLSNLVHGLILMALAFGLVTWSFFYEGSFKETVAFQQGGQVILKVDNKERVMVNRAGTETDLFDGKSLEVGDIVDSANTDSVGIGFARDGIIRLDVQTKVLLSYANNDKQAYTFKLLQGRIWLNNSYSTAEINLALDGAVVFPGQSVVYAKQDAGQATVYVNSYDAVLGIVATDYPANDILNENSPQVINKLYLPQGTTSTVFADKVKENKETIAKLLLSKMVKEFNYSQFDRTTLIADLWMSGNVEKDLALTTRIRDERLMKIRTRGLKYSSLDASNYKLDQVIRDVSNSLTFLDTRVGQRNLDALYDLLYDAQYLFDYGRKDEAQERLDNFTTTANQLFMVYGENLKSQYIARVKMEYEYLSFASPSDSLFDLKQVLRKIYLDSIKGKPEELFQKFAYLTDELSTIGYYAENNDSKNLDAEFTDYMTSFKDLIDKYQKEITDNITYVQRQNQGMDNLFIQYPALYREKYFTNKLFIENKYLTLLPNSDDRPEEMQNVIAQRIDCLRRLENFFLDGKVPLTDAQNIMALLFKEITNIELPSDYQVAIKALFVDRLQDYNIFSQFLNSPEYVSSSQRGATPKERFEAFKKDYQPVITVEQFADQTAQKITGGTAAATTGTTVTSPEQPATAETLPQEQPPAINEEAVTTTIDGQQTVTQNELTTSTSAPETGKVKVPRVKPAI